MPKDPKFRLWCSIGYAQRTGGENKSFKRKFIVLVKLCDNLHRDIKAHVTLNSSIFLQTLRFPTNLLTIRFVAPWPSPFSRWNGCRQNPPIIGHRLHVQILMAYGCYLSFDFEIQLDELNSTMVWWEYKKKLSPSLSQRRNHSQRWSQNLDYFLWSCLEV